MGMPPFFPPIAFFMAIEIAFMAVVISASMQRWPRANEWVVLVPSLLLGRIVYVGLVYALALVIELPAGFMAGLSLVSGWPGLLLMAFVVPSVARVGRSMARSGAMRERKMG
jgi:hypothetical protein